MLCDIMNMIVNAVRMNYANTINDKQRRALTTHL